VQDRDESETDTLLGRDRDAFPDLLACATMARFSVLYEFMNSRYRVAQSSLSMYHVNRH